MNAIALSILEEGLNKEQKEYCLRTLKDISRNESFQDNPKCKEFPTQSQLIAIDFDNVKTIYVNTLKERDGEGYRFRSADALYYDTESDWYLIEFKDGSVDVKEVYEKVEDSKNILMDLDILESGYLVVDSDESVLKVPLPGQLEFGFRSRMKKLGYQNSLDYFRKNFTFILVYNALLYKETEQDREAYRDRLKQGECHAEVEFLKNNSYILNGKKPEDYIKSAIEKHKFEELCEMIKKASEFDEETEKLAKIFEEKKDWRTNLLEQCKNVSKLFTSQQVIESLSGKEFLKALYIFSIDVPKIHKELKKAIQVDNLENHVYDDLIEVLEKKKGLVPIEYKHNIKEYIQKGLIYKGELEATYDAIMKKGNKYCSDFISAMAVNSKIPKRLFYLYKYEGKYFKKVLTYSEEEFEKEFVNQMFKKGCSK